MKKLPIVIGLTVLLVRGVFAQPTVSYITPDAGAPGMCVAVEIIGPVNSSGYGPDGEVLPPDTIVKLVNPSDLALVKLGPSLVSWNGRLIQQMIFIEPSVPKLDTSIQLEVVYGGQTSAPVTFHIMKPRDIGTLRGGGYFGQNIITARNTMVVDSLIFENGTYLFPTTDPDHSTPGNQGFLPARILSLGPIRFINAGFSVDGKAGNTSTNGGSGGAGGPGGGGGGAGYPGSGGGGYTGGGGDNDNSNGPGGVGTGSQTGSFAWTGGSGLSGVAGGNGEQHSTSGGDDGGGGGTGHPFGTSGTNGNNSSSPAGGYGAGSAGGSTSSYTANYGGGGGGYASSGTAGQGTGDNSGHAVGNSLLLPLAGGSGGGAGNLTYVSFFGGSAGGAGGGGGGAIELTSFADFGLTGGAITARGGNGSNAIPATFQPAAGGGGGSGGAIDVIARDSVVITNTGSFDISGGAGGTSSNSNSNGGAGGLGRVRLSGFVSRISGDTAYSNYINYFSPTKDHVGPSIAKVLLTKDSFTVIGFGRFWDTVPITPLRPNVLYEWSASGWQPTVRPTPFIIPGSHTSEWSVTLPISQNPADTELYIVAIQTDNAFSDNYLYIPAYQMSHTSGIIVKIPGIPKMLVKDTSIDFGNVLVDSCSHDTTIQIYSKGRVDLIIDTARLIPSVPNYKIKNSFPDTVHPGDSLALTLSFCPTVVKCPIIADLRIYSNGGDTTVALTGCGIQPRMVVQPGAIDFGRIHIGQCKDTFVTVSNPGTSPLIISAETIHDPRFTALDPLPISIPPGGSAHLNLRFCPSDTIVRIAGDSIFGNAPESPFMLILMGEGKIGILSLPTVLDFGLVHKGSCKDSGFYAVNTGNDSLIVTSESITGPSNFTLISPPTPFVLQADSSVFVTIRYCSTDTGSAQAFLGTTTDIPDSQTVILLAHTGIGILSIPNTIDFGAVPTGACIDTSILVRNVGTDTLFLTAPANLVPPFYYLGPTPLVLAPGASDSLKFRFCSTDTNTHRVTTQFDTLRAGVSPTFTLLGKGIEGALTTSGAIDVGCIAVGTDTTMKVSIRNTGTAALDSLVASVTPAGAATIVHSPPASLRPGAADSVVLIVPASSFGSISGTLTIVWRGGVPVTLPITGEVTTKPVITSLDTALVFDTTNVGDSSVMKCARFTNYSCIPVAVDSFSIAGGLPGEFEIVSNSAGPTLSDSTIATICIRYRPRRAGPASGEMEIKSGKNTIPIATLSGTGKGSAVGVQLAVDTVAGRPGEIINVPVRTRNDVTSASITSLTFRVTFNPMQLDLKQPVAPITLGILPAHTLSTTATYSVKTYSIGDKEITATYSAPLTGTPVVAELPLEILEPTANTASIHVMSASFGSSLATLSAASDGLIQIEQCDTNDRIALSTSPIIVAQNNPNPYSAHTTINVDVHFAGHLTVEVYNALGLKVLVPFNEDVVPGTHSILIDAGKLATGAYRYVTTWTQTGSTSYRPITARDEKTMIVLGE